MAQVDENSLCDAPAITPEAREQQLIAKAERLAEKKLEDGTASPMIIVHYLKLATLKEQKAIEVLEADRQLKMAKIESYQTAAKIEEMQKEAMEMFRRYSGMDDEESYD